MGRNNSVTDEMNGVSSVTYDKLGNVTKLQGPLGGATNYTYDNMGRLTAESTTSSGTVRYTYNELNLKKTLTNARGTARTYTYDANGRVKSYTDSGKTVSFTYDNNGNVLTVTDSNGTITRTFDALNRVTSCTDTAGKTIGYTYNAVGDLTRITYPDNTAVNYTYDANHKLITVTDWANRVTTYTYDVNNNVTGVTKPDGSVTTTVYDDKQRVTSHVERTASGAVITGFEYTYDTLGRISVEKNLAKNVKMCYTYDELSRVIKTNTVDLTTNEQTIEDFSYDAAGNITEGEAVYDANNRLTEYSCNYVSYDADGNMLNDPVTCDQYSYDFAKRLVTAGENTYTYNAEDTRIRAVHNGVTTTYTYDTNSKLSKLLCKTTSGTTTKYVYGLGLIGEETNNCFKTYHFDYRGSTVAITNANGTVTDTFTYNTYGKLVARTGSSAVIFGYNGRDGVITEPNGLLYMRARYYSPTLYRFINSDVIPGELSNSITLNRYAYANGNPVSNVDPFGLSVKHNGAINTIKNIFKKSLGTVNEVLSAVYHNAGDAIGAIKNGDVFNWGVNKFKELTRDGSLDDTIDLFIGTTPDEHGVYHIDQDYWQSIRFVGYNDLYDKVFDWGVELTGHTVDKKKFLFTTEDGTDYVIWLWKGDYVNLGSGAEVGIYEESIIPGHWLTSKENSMPMSLKLQEIDSGEVLFDYSPSEVQWWINGFDPSNQNAYASNLQVTVTIDFSKKKDLYTAFKNAWGGKGWVFDDMQATYHWRK